MDIKNIIEKQLQATRGGHSKNQIADRLEEMAVKLRAEAAADSKDTSFANRKGRLERYAAVAKKEAIQKRDAKLITAGWACGFRNDEQGISWWGSKAKPGHRLVISGGRFSVEVQGAEVSPSQKIEHLDSFISAKPKK